MTSQSPPGGPVRASRAARGARRRNVRIGLIAAAVIVVVIAGGWFALSHSGDACCPTPAPTDRAGQGPTHLLTFSVTGGSGPDMAVIGAGAGSSAAIPIPPELTLVVPGQGETLASGVARLPGRSQQVALSNLVGAWTQELAVMDLDGFAGVVDRMGGLTVDLPDVVVTSTGVLGPGLTKLDGRKAIGLLSAKSPDDGSRWSAVLSAFLADPPALTRGDLTAGSPVDGIDQVLDAARSAPVVAMPTEDVAGLATIAAQPGLDRLMASTFDTPAPIPAIVLNGNGTAGLGERVGRRIIPAGFRIALSRNAESPVPATEVIANGMDATVAARRARKALGVGHVTISQVASGIGDITIVVGKDFTA